ncbi:MAG TPA: ANTAR domain-containing protein [Jatrophihabitans sp.]|nr:ANTAR domain-containing protein [Jatrophihabitans sp.]
MDGRPVDNALFQRAASAKAVSRNLTADTGALRTALAESLQRVEQLAGELTQAREHIQNLETALATNRQIGTAIGILAVRRGLSPQEAFDVLRHTSQRSHRKLRELAEDVVTDGDIPIA